MNDAIEPIVNLIGKLKPRHDDDFVDRLHYLLTPTIFTTLALVIAGKQFVGQPIHCWAPNEMATRGAWMHYAESYCFMENTYFIGEDEAYPMQQSERKRREISYYQWVPFILMGQVLMLLAPKLIWNAFSWRNGFNVNALIQHAKMLTANGELEGKARASHDLGERIGRGILHHQWKGMKADEPIGKGAPRSFDSSEYFNQNSTSRNPSACFLTIHFILFKLLNSCVVFIQLVLLTKFLDNPVDEDKSFTHWGFAVIQDLWAGNGWRETGAFPRVTFCDFSIRQPTNGVPPLRYSLQCVLMVNMLNEKFFLFIWFWLIFLALIGPINLCIWIFRAISRANAEQFVRHELRFATPIVPSHGELANFVQHGLCPDAITVLRLIEMNCDPTVSAMLVLHLWNRYQQALIVGQIKAKMMSKWSKNSTPIHSGKFRQQSDQQQNGGQWGPQVQIAMSPPPNGLTIEGKMEVAISMEEHPNPSPVQQCSQHLANNEMDRQMQPSPDQSNLSSTSTATTQFADDDDDEQQIQMEMREHKNANLIDEHKIASTSEKM